VRQRPAAIGIAAGATMAGGGLLRARCLARAAVLAVAWPLLLIGCAPGPTVVVEPGGTARLAEIQTLQVELAEVATATPGAAAVSDIEAQLSHRLSGSLPEITVVTKPHGALSADRRGDQSADRAAGATLLYRRADQLEGYLRPQSTERWYWWATVLDADQRTLATLHGELPKSGGEPEAPLTRALARLFKRARAEHR